MQIKRMFERKEGKGKKNDRDINQLQPYFLGRKCLQIGFSKVKLSKVLCVTKEKNLTWSYNMEFTGQNQIFFGSKLFMFTVSEYAKQRARYSWQKERERYRDL